MYYRTILLLVNFILFSEFIGAQNWDLAKDKNGVRVYTRKIENWGIKEYKVKITVKASLSVVVAALKDVPGRYNWLHNALEIREVERPDKDVVIVYNKVDAPWPVSDRDNITSFSFSYPTSKSARIDMKAIATHKKAPIYDGVVRIKRIKGYWLLKDKGNGYVELIQQCVAEAGGSLPDWLVNSAVVDNPYNTMYKLKKYIES